MVPRRVRRLWEKFTRALGVAFVVFLFGTAVLSVGMYAAVHHTAQPEFCNSCHIMEPYYESWETSSHADVGCIECHYEPGAVETLHGKFEALSQLAKYVTRTQGTKPWAEVSDASCMRTGCHSVRMLEGRVNFERVAFDHRHHLLESRRGRRLRCVTCHSQIVQGDHLSVTSSVCFMCHFMPGPDGTIPEQTGGCLVCHGPPQDVVLVEGREFRHDEYVARGVSCKECHDPVVEGAGIVRRERCHSCHGEVGHIERIGEMEFLHEMHVTDHKVECFECHDEIHHGLLPLSEPAPAATEGCGSCHESSHDAALKLYSGRGAFGVEEQPSRMYHTRVVCRACHTGRSGRKVTKTVGPDSAPHGAQTHGAPTHGAPAHGAPTPGGHGSSTVARAGNIDCIHCHGVEFDGMLASWQAAVTEQLARIEPELAALGERLAAEEEHPAWELYGEARSNLQLVLLDGSRGVHNVTYALDALRASAERIERARELLGVEGEAGLLAGFRSTSRHGCDSCHAGVGGSALSAPATGAFPHRRHLIDAGLDCDACHSVEEHGRTLPRDQCASCHHQESDERDVSECATCHDAQEGLLRGLSEPLEVAPGVMAEMDCSECHGEPPALMRPTPQMCVMCHEEGYDALHHEWQAAVGEQLERLQPLLVELARSLPRATDHPAWKAYHETLRGFELVQRDGSRGAHNASGALDTLRVSAEGIDGLRALLELEERPSATEGFPYRSEHGCEGCHAGVGRPASVSPAERAFPHRRHLFDADLDCDACHSVEEHGQPSFPRDQCVTCHHQEAPGRDLSDCTGCHSAQETMLLGELPGFPTVPGVMAEMDCAQCHSEPPDLMAQPSPRLCVLCHEKGYDKMQGDWQSDVEERVARVQEALEAAPGAGIGADAVERARRALRAVVADGSRGVHNYELTKRLLEEALRELTP